MHAINVASASAAADAWSHRGTRHARRTSDRTVRIPRPTTPRRLPCGHQAPSLVRLTVSLEATYTGDVEDGVSAGGSTVESDSPREETPGTQPWRPPQSRVDPAAEKAALAWVRQDRRDEALKILMATYGAALTTFADRVLRDRELAKDVRQQVFLEAFQGIHRFEGRGSLWSWLCGIAYHRSLDERRRIRRAGTFDDLDVLDVLTGEPDPTMDKDRIAKQRALEKCLGALSPSMRAQVMLRYFLGLSYVEISEVIGAPHGTVQVRISRVLPRLRRCLRGEGVVDERARQA
jgi:RNA polymerase sigma-70 factor (ECF subfamily)